MTDPKDIALGILSEGTAIEDSASDALKSAVHHEKMHDHHQDRASHHARTSDSYNRHDEAADLHFEAAHHYRKAHEAFGKGSDTRGEHHMDKAERWADQAEDHEKRHKLETPAVNEMYGKGSIGPIKKFHQDRMTKVVPDGDSGTKFKKNPDAAYHTLQHKRASRLSDIKSGKGPLGKTSMKDRLAFAGEDSKKAKKLKPVNEAASDDRFDRTKRHLTGLGMPSHHIDQTAEQGEEGGGSWAHVHHDFLRDHKKIKGLHAAVTKSIKSGVLEHDVTDKGVMFRVK